MSALRSCQHDFPRLAKNAGYEFQLHRGKFKWSDIENLDLHDIIENRNYQLLENNLLNVINCDLDKECEVQRLDTNIVKLFKLAQLGVDYLSFCELYLDQCVAILEDQLRALQEEYQLLKEEKLTTQEATTCKKKRGNLQYQCEKCEKIFISDVYLKCHEKRRHRENNKSKFECLKDGKLKETITLESKTSNNSEFFQSEKLSNESHEKVGPDDDIHAVNRLNIDNLKKEVEDLKIRLNEAEKKNLDAKYNGLPLNSPLPFNFQSPIFLSPMMPYLPPSFYDTRSENFVFNDSHRTSLRDTQKFHNSNFVREEETQIDTNTNENELNTRKTSSLDELESDDDEKKVVNNLEDKKPNSNETLETNEEKEEYIDEKENVNPIAGTQNTSTNVNTAPKPFPRKSRRFRGNEKSVQISNHNIEPAVLTESDIPQPKTTDSSQNTLEVHPLHNSYDVTNSKKITDPRTDLTNSETTVKPNSIIRKIVNGSSPRFLEIGKNFKKSLSNLYESVSTSGKESNNEKNCTSGEIAVNSDENEIQAPTWSHRFSITREFTKQKPKEVKEDKKLQKKEATTNASKHTEGSLLKKLSRRTYWNFGSRKSIFNRSLGESESHLEPQTEELNYIEKKSVSAVYKNSSMYNVETDSESDPYDSDEPKRSNFLRQQYQSQNRAMEWTSDAESTQDGGKITEDVKREFDISIFQVDKGRHFGSSPRQKKSGQPNESSSEPEFLKNCKLNAENDKQSASKLNEEKKKSPEEPEIQTKCAKLNELKIDDIEGGSHCLLTVESDWEYSEA